jgi:hypothetical protein
MCGSIDPGWPQRTAQGDLLRSPTRLIVDSGRALTRRSVAHAKAQARSLAGGDLILALVSAGLGVIIAAWLSSERNGVAPSWLLFVVLCVIVALIALLVAKMNEVKRVLDNVAPVGLSKVRTITASEISEIAADLVTHSRTIRVIGTARQDIVATDEVAMNYLRATERRVKGQAKLYYRRITSTSLQPTFRAHLEAILKANDGSPDHDIQIALVSDLECSISYQIFDDTHAMIIVDAPTVPGIRDNVLAFLIEEGSMVAALIAHFDNAWMRRPPLKTIEAFRASLSEADSGGQLR